MITPSAPAAGVTEGRRTIAQPFLISHQKASKPSRLYRPNPAKEYNLSLPSVLSVSALAMMAFKAKQVVGKHGNNLLPTEIHLRLHGELLCSILALAYRYYRSTSSTCQSLACHDGTTGGGEPPAIVLCPPLYSCWYQTTTHIDEQAFSLRML